MSEKQRKIIKNVFYGFTSWILPLGLSFVATPIIIKALGYHEYGIYSLVLCFIGYSFTFNVGRAVTKYVAEYGAERETEKIGEIVSATFFINLVIGLIGLGLFFLLSDWLVENIFGIESESHGKTVVALYLGAVTMFFAIFGQIFSAVVQGIHRFDVYSKIVNLNSFTLLAGNIVIAWLNYGLLTLFGWNLLVTFLTTLLFFVVTKKLLPEITLFRAFTRQSLKLVVSYSAGVVGYQLLGNLLLLFERTWITRRFGTESLTFYIVPMLLVFQIHYFIASLVLVIFPLASELKNEKEKLLRLYAKSTKIVAVLVFFIALTIIVQSNHFLILWMGDDFAARATNLLIIHTVTYSLSAISIISWQMTEGLGYPNFNCLIYMISLIFTVPTMIFLSADYGTAGVAIGRLVGLIFLFFTVFYVERWFFGKVQWHYWLKDVFKIVAAAGAAAFVQHILNGFFTLSWITFLVSVSLGGVVYLLALKILGLMTADEKALFQRFFKTNE